MTDAYLYFSDNQVVNTDELSTILDLGDIEEAGRGSQLFIEIWVTDAYSAASFSKITIDLVTSSGADPDSTDILAKLVHEASGDTGGALTATGLLAKIPLPSTGLLDHVGLSYTVGTVDPSNGAISAFLTLT